MSKEIRFFCALLVLVLGQLALAFSAEPEEILLWPNGAPGSEGKDTREVVITGRSGERQIFQVHKPSITPFLPLKEKATGAAVLVIPGGGHRVLAWEHEGPNMAKWLAERGVAAFVLKYRLARETNSTYKLEVHPLADARKAMEMIRARAGEWNIDPKKVGAAGFSAGGELVAMMAGNFDFGDAQVEQGSEESKPNFQALIYPGKSRQIVPTKNSPVAFMAAAYDDRPDISEGLAELYLRFKKAGVRAELHMYSTGGHGFGVRENNTKPAGMWTERFLEWMKESGFVAK
ncbi:MAG TPA: alpha/beta hydrolase [Verrucomicrobiae bacterium]